MMNSESRKRFELRLGVLSPKMSTQLAHQGIQFDAGTMKLYEKHLNCILRLEIHGLLTGREKHRALKRLVKMVKDHLTKCEMMSYGSPVAPTQGEGTHGAAQKQQPL